MPRGGRKNRGRTGQDPSHGPGVDRTGLVERLRAPVAAARLHDPDRARRRLGSGVGRDSGASGPLSRATPAGPVVPRAARGPSGRVTALRLALLALSALGR